ncbi:MAG: CGLD27 family protein [Geitlerinemataceae cyanobacterium]
MKPTYLPICPVPDEQQPIVEYQLLSESCFFRSCTGEWRSYLTMLAGFWMLSFPVAAAVAAASFPPAKYPVFFFLGGAAGANFMVVLVLVRLYLGWKYIRSRLLDPIVFYEESGWYDGQSWQKTPEILDRDRLLANYQVKPILQRLQQTLIGLGVSYLIGGIVWVVM